MIRFTLRDSFMAFPQKLYLKQNNDFLTECPNVISREVQLERPPNSNSHIKMSVGVGFVLIPDWIRRKHFFIKRIMEPQGCESCLIGDVEQSIYWLIFFFFLGEQQKESGVESEAAGERESPAAAQEPGEPPQGRERGRQEALPGERRWHETHTHFTHTRIVDSIKICSWRCDTMILSSSLSIFFYCCSET